MPRRLLGVFILLLVSVFVGRAQGDVAFFTIGTDTVYYSEFRYCLDKSLEKRPDVLLQTLTRFKQKVQVARELGLDTVASYRLEIERYREFLKEHHALAENRKGSCLSDREWIKLRHITYPLNQRAGKKEELVAKKTLDSLYVSLMESENQVKPEEMPWMQTRHLLNEWQYQLKTLDKGTFSKPFHSPKGVHIIAWTDKRMDVGREEHPKSENMFFQIKEMEEGLLVASLDGYLEKTLVCAGPDLDNYFKKHKADYGWGTPHYRGAVIHCQNKKEAQRIKKYLKKFPEPLWQEAWERMPEYISKGCRMEIGLFAIGSNPYVDQLVFKCGKFETLDDYPYTWVLGKKLKKGPTTYTDVREKVEKNFRKELKNSEMEALMGKYEVEIDEEVLKTVNHEGNK